MTTSPDNADAALASEVASDGPVDITRASRPATELLVELEINLIARPDDWKQLVLETIGQWPEASETLDDEHYQYLIWGEAFDWRLLARRILHSAENAPETDLWQEWLDTPDLFGSFSEAEFMRILGVDKSRACLSFFYGVTVEQGLIVAAREEIAKRRVAGGRAPSDDRCDEVYQRLYGNDRDGLWDEYCAESGLSETDGSDLNPPGFTLGEGDSFTYWLFKRRMERLDPARVASDTRKGLAQLEKMLRSHDKRRRMLRQAQVV